MAPSESIYELSVGCGVEIRTGSIFTFCREFALYGLFPQMLHDALCRVITTICGISGTVLFAESLHMSVEARAFKNILDMFAH